LCRDLIRNDALIAESNHRMRRIWIQFKPVILAIGALAFMTLPALLAFAGD
jgi:hypothetical protein